MKSGIFIIAELAGAARERVHEIQQWADPKLAAGSVPHITIAGSSGVGAIRARTPVATLRAALEPIAATTAPIVTRFEAPHRFMQTNYIVLPLDPHGALRALHERIASSGLAFANTRFPFSPHCTLNFYQTLTPAKMRRLLAVRIEEPVVIDRIRCVLTQDPQPGRLILELPLGEAQPVVSSVPGTPSAR